jgi:tripartite-type tricarboxylate transporter receptor subunit TctC
MPLEVLKDLAHVSSIGEAPQLIAINADVPAKAFQEFVALAKAKPNGYQYGSAGPGSLPHLSVDTLARIAGIELLHVPYRGITPALTDLIAGRVHVVSSSIGTIRSGVDSGRIRLLLTATKQRLSYLPDVPTSAEAGIPDYLMSVWLGVVAPAGTPKPIVDRLHALTQGMIRHPSTQKPMASHGLEVTAMSQLEFAQSVQAEYKKWQRIVKEAGIEPQ